MNPTIPLWRNRSDGTFKQNDGAQTPIWDCRGKYTGYWRDKAGGDNSGQWSDQQFVKVRTGVAHILDRRDLTPDQMKNARPL